MKSLTALLKENNLGISAVQFNKKLLSAGILEEKERQSSKGRVKKFKSLTEKGLKYGENAVSPHNQKEVQPLYYSDTFNELFEMVMTADLSAWRGERKRGERDGEKKKKAYRSWSSNNNYMPYGYYNIIRKGDKSYKVRYYILIYDRFSMRSIN